MNRSLFCVLFIVGYLLSFSALAQNSLVVDETDRVQLPWNAPLGVPPGSDIGRMNPNFRMQMSLVLACSLRQLAEATSVLADQHSVWPGSLNLSAPQDCLVRHAELKEELPVVTSWLRSHGFAIEWHRGQHFAIRFSGTVAQVEEAFRVEIDTYRVHGKTYYGNTTNPSIPRRLSRLVLRVNALDNFSVTEQAGSSSSLDVVHSFAGTLYAPEYVAVIDKVGNQYGATAGGGSAGLGTVFQLDTAGHETTLYSFTGTNGDGANPAAGVIMDSAGNLYGTTEYGGVTGSGSGTPPAGCGTVFKLDPSGKETVLYSFTGMNGDGANPVAGLTLDTAGNLYGTTENGGQCVSGCGTVFKLDPSGKETVLYSFTGMNGDGRDPVAGVIIDHAGNLYGTTKEGGSTQCADTFGCGTVFKLDPSGKETVLYSFTGMNGDGRDPVAGLIMDTAGNLYGTTENGGQCVSGCGTVFKIDSSGHETVLYGFTGMNGDGANPASGLIMDSAGNLYGTTLGGGSASGGTVFKLDPLGHEMVLYSFAFTNGDGANPSAGLIMDNAGNLYGTTPYGGVGSCYAPFGSPPGCGTVFKLDSSGHETVLYSFTGTNGDGANPSAGLIMDSAGNSYGTTQFGGVASCYAFFGSNPGCGTVFKLDSSGHETVLYSFTGTNGDGANPAAGLIMDNAGNLYGTTPLGGITSGNCPNSSTNPTAPPPPGCGTVFKVDPSGRETVLYSFTLTNGDGAQPAAGLIMDNAGNLYGTTPYGGVGVTSSSCSIFVTGPPIPPGCGTVFKLDPSGKETVLYSFTGMNGDGAFPTAGLIMDSSGNLYGTTPFGGVTATSSGSCSGSGPPPAGCGTVFKLDPSGHETVLYSFTDTNGDGANPAAGVIMDSAGNLYGTTYEGGSAGAGTAFRLQLPADFSLNANPTSATVSAGSTANYSISLTPSGGFNQTVSLSCTGAPTLAACTVSPSSVTLDGTNAKTVAVQVTTTASQAALHPPPIYFPLPAINANQLLLGFLWLLGFVLLAILVQAFRCRLRVAFAIMILICLAAACGGGNGSRGSPGTPPGTYTLTVTATSAAAANLSHDAAITLTVN